MSKIIKIVDIEAGTEIEREMTAEEIADYELGTKAKADRDAENAAKESAKEAAQAKLAALGLTADDLNALGL
jgi:hypothetical protein